MSAIWIVEPRMKTASAATPRWVMCPARNMTVIGNVPNTQAVTGDPRSLWNDSMTKKHLKT